MLVILDKRKYFKVLPISILLIISGIIETVFFKIKFVNTSFAIISWQILSMVLDRCILRLLPCLKLLRTGT